MQEGREFGGKNVPRGTLLWNGNQQTLVCVEKLFLEKISKRTITSLASVLSTANIFSLGLRYVSQSIFCVQGSLRIKLASPSFHQLFRFLCRAFFHRCRRHPDLGTDAER